MNILGFDTCFESCSVAVGVGLGGAAPCVVARQAMMATGQAEALMPMIEDVMSDAAITFDALDRIAVTTGPGTFTGMRIGIAAARALSLALHIPVVGMTSFDVLAAHPALRGPRGSLTAVVMDARRGQCYAQVVSGEGEAPVMEPQLFTLEAMSTLGGSAPIRFAGSGAAIAADAARRAGREVSVMLPELQPDMAYVLEAARLATPHAGPPRPLYLRPPDAKPQDGKSLARIS